MNTNSLNIRLKINTVIQIVLFIILIIIDQLTKFLAISFLKGKEAISIIQNAIYLYYLENRGAAFGIFKEKTWAFYIITGVVIIIIVALFIMINKRLKRYNELSKDIFKQKTYNNMVLLGYIFSVLAAGAIGNLIDRVAYHYVVDFIYFKFIDFPIFNFADICVTLSAIFMIIFFIFIYKEDENFHLFSKK